MTGPSASSSSPQEEEPLLDVARGDAAESRQLRQALTLLRDQSDNDGFRKILDEVIAGRVGLRDVFTSPEFASGLDPMVEQFAEQYEALSEEERQELAQQGEQDLAAQREEIERERLERERNDR